MSNQASRSDFETSGCLWIRGALSTGEIDILRAYADVSTKPGERLTTDLPPIGALSEGSALRSFLNDKGLSTDPVRIVAFNKTQASNWGVPWHQDRIIAVKDRATEEGFSNFVRKQSFWHCEPPPRILERMAFARLFLDPDTEETGPLEIALGSHRHGAVSAEAAAELARGCNAERCLGEAGDILIVHALTLHRSRAAIAPSSRRSLRLDFADRAMLPAQMTWAY